ncbi:Hypothetical protein NTJ_14896 [Nesidiocoris tenuis]|uniref:Tetraspanin n=1 Tax=Nesidiocoris tenuis TaxID=355587 RepID=A0ABN7BEF2_9HEMI|nr:Hypothetical protein NTJ_14896 [Nesidiocoris tenuis]
MKCLEIAFYFVNALTLGPPVTALALQLVHGYDDNELIAFEIVVFLVLSMFTVSVFAMGIVAVCREIEILQFIYMLFQGANAGFHFICGVFCIVSSGNTGYQQLFDEILTTSLTSKMMEYEMYKGELDQFQRKFECCGTKYYGYEDRVVPPSCCKSQPCKIRFRNLCDLTLFHSHMKQLDNLTALSWLEAVVAILAILFISGVRKNLKWEI